MCTLANTQLLLEEMWWQQQLATCGTYFHLGQRRTMLRSTVLTHIILLNLLVAFGYPFGSSVAPHDDSPLDLLALLGLTQLCCSGLFVAYCFFDLIPFTGAVAVQTAWLAYMLLSG